MIHVVSKRPHHLLIVSRNSSRVSTLKRLAGSTLLTLALCAAVVALFSWLDGEADTRFAGVCGLVVGFGLLGVLIVAAPRLLFGRERIELTDRQFILERYVGAVRTSRTRYDLLRMHGLQVHALADQAPFSDAPGDVAPYAIRFFYVNAEEWFGQTLAPDEQEQVVRAMTDYDVALRASLGLDPAKGLARTEIWTSPEAYQAMVDEYVSHQRAHLIVGA